jgi:spire-like protein
VKQLRDGVKLRAVDPAEKKPVEFELSPYEMLMNDIRSKR